MHDGFDWVAKQARAGVYNVTPGLPPVSRRVQQQERELAFRKNLAMAAGWVFDTEIEREIFRRAWEQSHSEGYESVVQTYADLDDLVRIAKRVFE